MENLIKNESFYQVKGFMINELNLKGNELIVFAIIHTIKECGGVFYGSRNYLAQFTNSTIRSVQSSLNKLVIKGLLKKETSKTKDGIKVSYSSTYDSMVKKLHHTGEKIASPSEKIAPNKKDNNLKNNINNKYISEGAPIDLKSYLLKDFSDVSKDLFFTDMSILENENKIILALPPMTYRIMQNEEFYKVSIDRQLRFYNIQHNTNYELEIKEKVGV